MPKKTKVKKPVKQMPKGMHKMPNGMMKNSEMKKKMKY